MEEKENKSSLNNKEIKKEEKEKMLANLEVNGANSDDNSPKVNEEKETNSKSVALSDDVAEDVNLSFLKKHINESRYDFTNGDILNKTEDCYPQIDSNISLFKRVVPKYSVLQKVYRILLAFFVVLIVTSVILIQKFASPSISQLLAILVAVFGIVIIAVIYILNVIVNKKKDSFCIKIFTENIASLGSYTYRDEKDFTLKEVRYFSEPSDASVINAHYFSLINSIKGRACVEGEYLNYTFRDYQSYIIGGGKLVLSTESVEKEEQEKETEKEANSSKVVFYGKMIVYDYKLKEKDGLIIVVKGPGIYLPNYLKGYQQVNVEGLSDNIIVYATNDTVTKSVLNKKSIDILNSLYVNDDCRGMYLTLNDKGTNIGIAASEEALYINVDEGVKQENLDSLVKETKLVMSFLRTIVK